MHCGRINSPVHVAHDDRQPGLIMIKNLTTNQLVLIVIATLLLLLAAFSFYLLQNPLAPLPFAPPPRTISPTAPALALTIISAPTTLAPTRQTSYTPYAAFITPGTENPSAAPLTSETPGLGITPSPGTPYPPPQTQPVNTLASTPRTPAASTTTSPSASVTTSPAATTTLSPGDISVTGRVLQNGTPVANVVVVFADDVTPRQGSTDQGGHYRFITLAPGVNFSLTFNQADNLRLTPTAEVASLAKVEGTLPTGVNIIDLPDFEVSLNLSGSLFELQSPTDGAAYSASAISTSNPIQFNWSLYPLGGTYQVQVGSSTSDIPAFSSSQLAATSYMWNGTLDDGSHITQGTYWWRVAVTKSLGNYVVVIYTQQFDLVFNP